VLTRSQRTAFDIDEFYSALDAERSARGLTWLRVTREINSLFRDVPARPISPSTLTGMRGRRAIEGNGVLQMLVWLGRRRIPGIEPGRTIQARGRLAVRDGRKVLHNPYYELQTTHD